MEGCGVAEQLNHGPASRGRGIIDQIKGEKIEK